jgi:hypothetical protein
LGGEEGEVITTTSLRGEMEGALADKCVVVTEGSRYWITGGIGISHI